MPFTVHSIKSETLGDFLKETRQSIGWDLRDVEKRIGIPVKYLEAIETNNYYQLPSPTYARGFLERYAEFLDLKKEEILNRYRQESNFYLLSFQENSLHQGILPGFSGQRNGFFKKEWWLKFFERVDLIKIIIGLIILVVLVYFGLGVKKIILPPKLIIISPQDNLVTQTKFLIIEGKVDQEVTVMINDQLIGQMNDGKFKETIELQPGLNLIKISAVKKPGHQSVVWRKITLVEEGGGH